ncbi:MAG: polyphosphate:AMP phosphotransferase [Thiohalobacterales bacterium]
MFRTAELGQKIPKSEYRQREPVLRQELLEAQANLVEAGEFPVIVLCAGVDGAGKGETVNLLNEWMDPRLLLTRAYDMPSEEEQERPEYWRFWRDLPPKGRIGLYQYAWYAGPVHDRLYEKDSAATFDDRLMRCHAFEEALTEGGALIIKFWLHLSKAEQKKSFKKLEKDPLTKWRVTRQDWDHWRRYDEIEAVVERAIMRTSTGRAPWNIVEGVDPNYRSLTVGTTIRDAIRKHADEFSARQKLREVLASPPPATDPGEPSPATVLSGLDMSLTLSRKDYREQLGEWQGKLNRLHRKALKKKLSTILLFEGPDAAGKGGAIRRITAALDARHYEVIPIAAPTDEERAQHYLWRFWRQLSRAGRVTIFDRSWYGRVLVERVEGFAAEDEWRRAYAEINEFEEQLTEHGILLVKYWVHIDSEEQLERFKAREQIPYKSWKLTGEDWRNREKSDAYGQAVNDIVEHTSMQAAPWTIVEGNDKHFARIKVLKTLCNRLEAVLKNGGKD